MATVSSMGAALAVVDILRIAQEDAEGAYGDLSGLKITISRSVDGWHVDYDLTDPLSAGGGPHYIIDPDSGSILARNYEQ